MQQDCRQVNAAQVLAAGADGVAVVSAIMAAALLRQAAEAIRGSWGDGA
ncbi:hypothetical protein [Trichlorobacter lovleyi]|nr:hypothetical protein [Trichlorobacter lovleyi]